MPELYKCPDTAGAIYDSSATCRYNYSGHIGHKKKFSGTVDCLESNNKGINKDARRRSSDIANTESLRRLQQTAYELKLPMLEVSAKHGINVIDVFRVVAARTYSEKTISIPESVTSYSDGLWTDNDKMTNMTLQPRDSQSDWLISLSYTLKHSSYRLSYQQLLLCDVVFLTQDCNNNINLECSTVTPLGFLQWSINGIQAYTIDDLVAVYSSSNKMGSTFTFDSITTVSGAKIYLSTATLNVSHATTVRCSDGTEEKTLLLAAGKEGSSFFTSIYLAGKEGTHITI